MNHPPSAVLRSPVWALLALLSSPAAAQPFTQSFGSVASLGSDGWLLRNNSQHAADPAGWYQGSTSFFAAHSGAPTGYIQSNYLASSNTTSPVTLSAWLIGPTVSLRDGDLLAFWTRAYSNTFPDRMQVRMSTAGPSVFVGTAPADVGDFATLLLDLNAGYTASGYPQIWSPYILTLAGIPGAPQGRFAFRYFVENGGFAGANSYYVGLDSVSYAPAGAICPLSFSPASHHATAPLPNDASAGDFNNDGWSDAAVVHLGGQVAILLAGPSGLQPAGTIAAGGSPVAAASADVNGDARADLVIANESSNTLHVRLSNGDGTFQPPLIIATASGPNDVAIADLNGDTRPDLVAVHYYSNDAWVWLASPSGGYLPPASYPLGGSAAHSLVLADFNGDGTRDMAVANLNSHNVSLLRGNPGGTFQAATLYPVGTTPYSVAAADFNGDHRDDLAVACYTSNAVYIAMSGADGVLQPATAYAGETNPISVATPDLNGDGRPDLAIADHTTNSVSVRIGLAGGAFLPPVSYPVGPTPYALIFADFDRNGRTDALTANRNGGGASLLRNLTCPPCYPNCDQSAQPPILNVQDFSCFLTRYAAGEPYANCDGSTQAPVLNVQDFSCFLTAYAAGCR